MLHITSHPAPSAGLCAHRTRHLIGTGLAAIVLELLLGHPPLEEPDWIAPRERRTVTLIFSLMLGAFVGDMAILWFFAHP